MFGSKKRTTNNYDYSQTDNSVVTAGLGSSNVSGAGNSVSTHIVQNDAAMVGRIAELGFDSLNQLGSDAFWSASQLGGGAFDLSRLLGRDAMDLSYDTSRLTTGLAESLGLNAIWSGADAQADAFQLAADATRSAMSFVDGYTERSQLGAAAGQNDALKWVALAAVVMVGIVLLKGKN